MTIRATQLRTDKKIRKTDMSESNLIIVGINSKGICHMCEKPLPLFDENTEVEHLHCYDNGGTNDYFNLKLACNPCNLQKGNSFDHPINPNAKTEATFQEVVDFLREEIKIEYAFGLSYLSEIVDEEIKTRRSFNKMLSEAYKVAKATYKPSEEDEAMRAEALAVERKKATFKR